MDRTGSLRWAGWKPATALVWKQEDDILGVRLRHKRKKKRNGGTDCLVVIEENGRILSLIKGV